MAMANQTTQFSRNAGIAIGPILFIIAILGILAAAIAAGSGSFTAGTSTESARTKASALIQIGENLKVGMDRITMSNSLTLSQVIVNSNNTANNVDLFAPTGGGIAAPSASLSNNSAEDAWFYPAGALPGLGATASTEKLAVLKVDSSTCNEINNKANGVNTPAVGDYGNFAAASETFSATTTWPFTGKTVGCVQNNNTGATGYYFFQVLYIQ